MPELSNPVPTSAHHIRKGGLIFMKGKPCKITETATSKTGKHGHAKITYQGVDIFTGQKYSDVKPGHAVLMVPPMVKTEYTLCDIDAKEDTLDLMTEKGDQLQLNFACGAENSDAHPRFAELNAAFDEGKDVLVTTITSCEEQGEGNYVNKEVFDSFKVANN